MIPASWTGGTPCPNMEIVLIKYIDTVYGHAANTNSGGSYFLGLKGSSTWLSQTVTVPMNTYFAIKFDYSARNNWGSVPKLQVLCWESGNNNPTTTTSTTSTTTTILLLLLLLLYYYYTTQACANTTIFRKYFSL